MAKAFTTTEAHAGKYVALRGRDDDTVIASGDDPKEVLEKARAQGTKKPIIAYVPEKNSVMIY